MSKLIILRGVSGSGKSTWARNQTGYLVVSRDSIREMQYGSSGKDYYDVPNTFLMERESVVTMIQDSMIEGALRTGVNVIVDNTNIEWRYVKALAKIANKVGAEVEIRVFDAAVQTAITNDHMRAARGGRSVGADIIRKQHQRLQGTIYKELEPVFVPAPYEGTPGKPKAFLVDIDGTLAHMRDYRGPYDWQKVHLDDADESIVELVNYGISEEYTVIVMSGRDESCRDLTETWLDRWVRWDDLFMRPEKDMRPDNIIKAELFDKYVRDNFDVKFVLDDRDQVVQMWRSMGLKCLQVAEGNF